MKMYVVRSIEKGFGTCYHGKDGVCERNPIDAVKYPTIEAAEKSVGNPYELTYDMEIVPIDIETVVHEDEVIVIHPRSDLDE